MASKGYCTPTQVAAYTGSVFTTAQSVLSELIIEAAEHWIDNELEHAWLETSPIVETIYNPQDVYVRLKKAPIISVTSIVASMPACADVTLIADTNYWLQDVRDGKLWLPYTRYTYKLVITYVPNDDPVPAEIQLAAMSLASANMRLMPTMMDGVDPNMIEEYNVGGELRVRFRKNLMSGGLVVPQQVLNYLDAWRRNYVVV